MEPDFERWVHEEHFVSSCHRLTDQRLKVTCVGSST